MTSTSFNVGLTDNTRLSSRVLRPPGGGHTDIFGGEPEQVRGKRAGPPQTDSFQEAKAQENAAAAAAKQAAVQNGSAPAPEPAQPAQAAPAAPEPVQQKSNPAPPKAEAPKPAAEAPKPSGEPPKRVRVPPGGFSSGLW